MRVLLVVKGLDIGGIERIVVDLATGLTAAGDTVEVAVVNGSRDGLLHLLQDAGVRTHDLGGHDRIGRKAARRLTALVAEGRFDVVHVHGPLTALLVRLAPGVRPLITTSHTPWRTLHPAVRLGWWATVRRDRASVAVSAAVAESLPRRFTRRVRVIPHGVDPARIHQAAADPYRSIRPTDGAVVALAVASHRDVKNYPNLLRALRAARQAGADLHLVAVGEGPELERHRSLAVSLGLGAHVDFLEPRPDVLPLVAAADFLVVASDFEGAPLVVIEALALGRPVVATAVGRVPELVGPAVGIVVPPGNATALGAAMAEVTTDSGRRASMAAAAAAIPLRWSLSEVIAAHQRLYREVAG
jgi:glycosyltransferase involved in cell wall biosynthesis